MKRKPEFWLVLGLVCMLFAVVSQSSYTVVGGVLSLVFALIGLVLLFLAFRMSKTPGPVEPSQPAPTGLSPRGRAQGSTASEASGRRIGIGWVISIVSGLGLLLYWLYQGSQAAARETCRSYSGSSELGELYGFDWNSDSECAVANPLIYGLLIAGVVIGLAVEMWARTRRHTRSPIGADAARQQGPTDPEASLAPGSIEERLAVLERLRRSDQVSEDEFQQKREEILREL